MGSCGLHSWRPPRQGHGVLLICTVHGDSPHTLTPFRPHIQGALQIVRTVTLRMVVISQYNLNAQTTEKNNPELAFQNYVKDLKAYENHGCSYKDHITDIIDALI